MELRVNLTDKQMHDVAASLPLNKLLEITMTKCFLNQEFETGHIIRELLEKLNNEERT